MGLIHYPTILARLHPPFRLLGWKNKRGTGIYVENGKLKGTQKWKTVHKEEQNLSSSRSHFYYFVRRPERELFLTPTVYLSQSYDLYGRLR